jgi:hypothetical protein
MTEPSFHRHFNRSAMRELVPGTGSEPIAEFLNDINRSKLTPKGGEIWEPVHAVNPPDPPSPRFAAGNGGPLQGFSAGTDLRGSAEPRRAP